MCFFARLLFVATLLTIGMPVLANAQEAMPDNAQENLPELEGADEFGPARDAATLDSLFADLKHEPRSAAGRRIARQIWQIWLDSGSDTINLLMEWSAEAVEKKKYATASDLLDQVTVLKPDYAEGWNRRATLLFLMADYGRSLSDIERTLRLEPRHFGALTGLAEIFQKSGQESRALEAWYRILEIYPANERAQKAVIELEEELSGQGT
jgi:tetratricopeptide (TPR) repeat protein